MRFNRLAVLAVMFICGCGGIIEVEPDPFSGKSGLITACSYGGQDYSSGSSFPSVDGCNSCGCQSDGTVVCTERACAATCAYNGVTYQAGEGFPSADGCNSCGCQADGSVVCTELACP